jgi:hypothetical protein
MELVNPQYPLIQEIFGEGNEHSWGRTTLWCKLINHFFIKKKEDKIKGSVKTSALSISKISYVSRHDPFLKKMERAFIDGCTMTQRKGC